MSNDSQVHGLWIHPRATLVTQPLLASMFLLLAWGNLFGDHSNTWDRAMGFAQALLSGLLFGVTLTVIMWRRMVRRHMDADHPGVPVSSKRPW